MTHLLEGTDNSAGIINQWRNPITPRYIRDDWIMWDIFRTQWIFECQYLLSMQHTSCPAQLLQKQGYKCSFTNSRDQLNWPHPQDTGTSFEVQGISGNPFFQCNIPIWGSFIANHKKGRTQLLNTQVSQYPNIVAVPSSLATPIVIDATQPSQTVVWPPDMHGGTLGNNGNSSGQPPQHCFESVYPNSLIHKLEHFVEDAGCTFGDVQHK